MSDLGKMFGKWVVSEIVSTTQFLCECECGTTRKVDKGSVRHGRSTNCGCARKGSVNRKHGLSGTRTYRAWSNMIQRCTNPKNDHYYLYGGRGISVCNEWASFDAFLKDMGECPRGYSLERMRVNDGYAPTNCCWIPKANQAFNKRNSVRVDVDGKVVCAAEAARILGVPATTLRLRLRSATR